MNFIMVIAFLVLCLSLSVVYITTRLTTWSVFLIRCSCITYKRGKQIVRSLHIFHVHEHIGIWGWFCFHITTIPFSKKKKKQQSHQHNELHRSFSQFFVVARVRLLNKQTNKQKSYNYIFILSFEGEG